MAGRYPPPRPGGLLVKNPPTGFPLFCSSTRSARVVTADPWAFYRHLALTKLNGGEAVRALPFIDQAYDFFRAARNPHAGSRPVLYYYCFLNLIKAALLIQRSPIPVVLKHGISDPKANQRSKLQLSGQHVRILGRARDRSDLFPEAIVMLGGLASKARDFNVIDLLAQVPCIHRTFTRVSGKAPSFCPVDRTELFHDRSSVWARLGVNLRHRDVQSTLPRLKGMRRFQSTLVQVRSAERGEAWFETKPAPGRTRGVNTAIQSLSKSLQALTPAPILTTQGYRMYLPTTSASSRLPPLAVGYAVAFYLGSVTRYRPDVFDKILTKGYAWVVEEFLATYPMQFIYGLASEVAGVDVVRPYAALE